MRNFIAAVVFMVLSSNAHASAFKMICGDLDVNARPYHSFLIQFDDVTKRASMGSWYDTSQLMRSTIDHASQVPGAVSPNLVTFGYRTPLGALNSLVLEWKNLVNGVTASAQINQVSPDAWKGQVAVGPTKFTVGCSFIPSGIPLE